MAKKKKKQVRLVSNDGDRTGVFYVTTNTTDTKLKLRKYDKKKRKHCWFTQDKID